MTGAILHDWSDLDRAAIWGSLLTGNGASRNIWSKFKYESLYEKSEPSLSAAAKTIFSRINTTNFELALKVTHYAALVDEALGRDATGTKSLHEEVRQALFDAVRAQHVPHATLGFGLLEDIALILARYRYVYTTNYDLIPYWAAMASEESKLRLKDMFWAAPHHVFDRSDSGAFGSATIIHYLHGGIHLWMNPSSGQCGKWVLDGDSLLNASHFVGHPDRVPLLISEADSKQKASAVGESDYLRFCFERLLNDRGNLVVFGASLSEIDEHVLRAIAIGPPRHVAIGMRKDSATESEQARLREKLDRHGVHFFDASTHPLGSSGLNKG
ncbi:hypothetical protein Aab01nite_07370 [Paractinoplanes abujensis]|uniref:SIR2-like domain-containing protein n=1 Tax=Paractinoplanes abujensis TaxID=882441 RepID=A0A7W7CMS2_9ACTN|nr:DUF4917 family protein [Actinoplanes abujensis]MBB4691439.1 hypothetical protein [Actinoplanes abujensis]GID17147.1 hypothetical protein Aab01nite_07370 [Actinoplanes abujensis]